MKYLLLFFGICICTPILKAQSNYSTQQKDAFTKVFYQEKQTPKNNHDKLISALLEKHQVPNSRYATIIQSSISGTDLNLSAEETLLLDDIQKENIKLERTQHQILLNLCMEHGMPFSVYQEMLLRFRSDIHFQHELKPHFDQYLNDKR